MDKIAKIEWSPEANSNSSAQTRIVGIAGVLRINRKDTRYIFDSIFNPLWNCSFNKHSLNYALKRTLTSTPLSTRFGVSRVYHFTIKASLKFIVFHWFSFYIISSVLYGIESVESSWSVGVFPMVTVSCWSLSMARSWNIGPSQTSNCFELHYPQNT